MPALFVGSAARGDAVAMLPFYVMVVAILAAHFAPLQIFGVAPLWWSVSGPSRAA